MATKPKVKPAISRSKSSASKRGAAVRTAPNTGTMAAAAAVSVDKPLTEKQKEFVKFWAEGDSIPNALARAGYSVADNSLGYRMAKMPNVLALKAKYQAQYEEAAAMTKKKVMDMHLEAFEMAKLMSEPATMVSAAREVGKLCGYYEPQKVQLDVNVNQSLLMGRVNQLSDAELLKIIESNGTIPLLEAAHADDSAS
jgi:phage terminase small subunit